MPDLAIKSRLSTLEIDPRQRLIFALDFPSGDAAWQMIEALGDSVQFFKIGWELFMSGDAFKLGEELHAKKKKVMLDLKFFDVPETVGNTVRNIREWADFATVQGYPSLVKEAAKMKNGSVQILAVTVLTSLDQADMEDLGFECTVEELVLHRARRCLDSGANGVIASGLEASKLREAFADRESFLIVTPGIRPEDQEVVDDDQKRTSRVEDAFAAGADYIVVGRPIRDAKDPRAAALNIQKRIRSIFS